MGIYPICDPPRHFQKSGSVTFVPKWYPNFMQKLRKTKWTVSESSKDRPTDGLTERPQMDGQG